MAHFKPHLPGKCAALTCMCVMKPRREHRTCATAAALLVIVFAGPASSQVIEVLPRSSFAVTRLYQCYPFPCNSNESFVETPYAWTSGLADFAPTWSPDARYIAFVRGTDLAVMAREGGEPVNVTNTPGWEGPPAWSPDGLRIAFVSDRDGQPDLYLMNPDGSNAVRVTSHAGVRWGRPAWSPNGQRLAFDCEVEPGNEDICVVGTDGSNLIRLTNDPGRDIGPAWAALPGGEKIAFATTRFVDELVLVVMNVDGSGVSMIRGYGGWNPAWSPDGTRIAFISNAFDGTYQGLFVMNADGSNVSLVTDYADWPAWIPGRLHANFGIYCESLTCSFDAASSVGSIATYTWDFGDQTTGSGSAANHVFADGGHYAITLTVTDMNGATDTDSRTIYLNFPPVASFIVSCEGLECIFDWSASYDPDGTGVLVNWDFGDGTGSWYWVGTSNSVGRHTYAVAGTYTATIRVADSYNSRSSTSRTFTLGPPPPSMHVGDLDWWKGTPPTSIAVAIWVHRDNEAGLGNAVVTALWNDQIAASCTTNGAGRCVISRTGTKPKTATSLRIVGVTLNGVVYDSAANHDADGDSDGTTITMAPR
jgi:PKD domain-containing protein/WD40 repeat protein